MNELTQKVIDFCKDSKQIFFPLDTYGGSKPLPKLGYSRRGVIKVPITQNIIGLAVTAENDFAELAATLRVYMEFYGYYSVHTGKLYFNENVKSMAEFWDEKAGRHGRYLEYEPMPCEQMTTALSKALTEKLTAATPYPNVDVLNDDINIAKEAFFYGEIQPAAILPEDIRQLMKKYTKNSDTELYLAQPDVWLQKAVDGILAQHGETLSGIFQQRLTIQAILKKLKGMPQHPWTRADNLASAVTGKTTVTVTVKHADGPLTFRMKAYGLGCGFAGQYSSEHAVAGDKHMLRDQYHLNIFGIDDIQNVTYNGKVIFSN